MGVSKNSGTPKTSILIGFSTLNHPFSGTPIFGNTQMGPENSTHKVNRARKILNQHLQGNVFMFFSWQLPPIVLLEATYCDSSSEFHPKTNGSSTQQFD